jgi:hypothetical protein
MKRLDLVQLAIIIVGIFNAYYFVVSLPQFFFLIYTWFSEGASGGYYLENLFANAIIVFCYFLVTFYCIKRSKHFAEWICNNANLNAEINFRLDKTELLFVLFVGLGIFGLIQNIPSLLVDGYNKIKSSNRFSEIGNTKLDDTTLIIKKLVLVFFYFVLIYYAKVFADFLAARINNQEPEDTIAEKIE